MRKRRLHPVVRRRGQAQEKIYKVLRWLNRREPTPGRGDIHAKYHVKSHSLDQARVLSSKLGSHLPTKCSAHNSSNSQSSGYCIVQCGNTGWLVCSKAGYSKGTQKSAKWLKNGQNGRFKPRKRAETTKTHIFRPKMSGRNACFGVDYFEIWSPQLLDGNIGGVKAFETSIERSDGSNIPRSGRFLG